MAKDTISSPFDPETILPKMSRMKSWMASIFSNKKKLVIVIIAALFIGISLMNIFGKKKPVNNNNQAKTVIVEIGKSFDFPALNNQGKTLYNTKIKMKIDRIEKTDQVFVSDKTVSAKNNKKFLIVQLELKNDATQLTNLLPGDLIRLTVGGDEENKFAPDLHNNLVPVSAISTKLERVGFVIPEASREFKLYVGEIEGKKETISVNFPS